MSFLFQLIAWFCSVRSWKASLPVSRLLSKMAAAASTPPPPPLLFLSSLRSLSLCAIAQYYWWGTVTRASRGGDGIVHLSLLLSSFFPATSLENTFSWRQLLALLNVSCVVYFTFCADCFVTDICPCSVRSCDCATDLMSRGLSLKHIGNVFRKMLGANTGYCTFRNHWVLFYFSTAMSFTSCFWKVCGWLSKI